MCKAPKVKTPPPVQDAKMPDLDLLRRSRKSNSMAGNGTLLTGMGGVGAGAGALNTGAVTLLGA